MTKISRQKNPARPTFLVPYLECQKKLLWSISVSRMLQQKQEKKAIRVSPWIVDPFVASKNRHLIIPTTLLPASLACLRRERETFSYFHFIFGNPCNVMSHFVFYIFGQKSIFLASVDFFIPPSLSLEAFCRSDCTAYDFGFIFRNASCHFPSFFIYLCTVRKYCFFFLDSTFASTFLTREESTVFFNSTLR